MRWKVLLLSVSLAPLLDSSGVRDDLGVVNQPAIGHSMKEKPKKKKKRRLRI